MRLFIAVPLPEKIQNQIFQESSDLRGSDAPIHWIPHENLHLTLKFLGEVPADRIQKIQDSMINAVKDFHPFEINFAGVGAFPSLTHPRVIWVGTTEGQETLAKLAKELENQLEVLGFSKEERPYKSHLTIGRVRERKSVKDFKEKAVTFEKTSFAGFSVNMISLMQSILSPKGAAYKTVYEVKLT